MNKILNDYAAKTNKKSTGQIRKRFHIYRKKNNSGSFKELGLMQIFDTKMEEDKEKNTDN